jgi:hypothetical protein
VEESQFMSESEATLIVVRPSNRFGRLHPFEIHLDGRLCGHVDDAGFAVIDCTPGTHEVMVKLGWWHSRSQSLTVTLRPGGRVQVVCRVLSPISRAVWSAKVALAVLVGFAILDVLVPSVKSALKPYEHLWGPIFLVMGGLSLVCVFAEAIPQALAMMSRTPGKLLGLTEQEPTVSNEMIDLRRLETMARTGRPS